MNANEIVEILNENFNRYYKTVLISGNWGVGKTYYVKQFLEGKINSIYISLFGKNNIDDIKMDIYSELNKNNIKAKGWKIRKKLEGLQIGIDIFSITLPQMKLNIEKVIEKYQKENVIFVFDDLERKSEKITIEEILGFIEWLNQIDKVKIIILSNEDEMKDEKYNRFKEKVIQKTYKINNYSEDASLSIMNYKCFKKNIEKLLNEYDYNNLIQEFLKKHKFKNLRTLEKCVPYLEKILDKIDFSCIIKEDLCEIIVSSMAVVIESIDMLYIEDYKKDEDKDKITYDILKDEGQELSARIIKYYFNLPLIHDNKYWLIKPLIDIFNDLKVNKKIIEINNIYKRKNNNSEKKLEDFYCSEDQMRQRISDFNKTYIKNHNMSLKIDDWLKMFNNYYSWAELLKMESLFKQTDVNKRINQYVDNMKLTDDNAYTYLGDFDYKRFYTHEYILGLHKTIYELIALKYYSNLFDRIKTELSICVFNEELLDNFTYFYRNPELCNIDKLKRFIEKTLKENNYFIPDFEKELSNSSWSWSHSIWKFILQLSPEYQNVKDDFMNCVKKLKKQYNSIIANHRIDILNERYPI